MSFPISAMPSLRRIAWRVFRQHYSGRRLMPLCGLLALLGASPASLAGPDRESGEAWNEGWAITLDDDLFAPRTIDSDYTGGLSFTLRGRRAAEYPITLDPLLGFLDRLLGVDGLRGSRTRDDRHALQIGAMLFTPNDLEDPDPQFGERPYASLLYVENSRLGVDEVRQVAYRSTLGLGALGLPAGGAFQASLHRLLQGQDVHGWRNQVSHGGEPTLLYAVSRQALVSRRETSPGHSLESAWSVDGSFGYLTEVSAGAAVRWGRINSPWWSFAPDLADYADRPGFSPGASPGGEWYFWSAFRARGRAWNSFLQGQFRDSPVKYYPADLHHLIGELSLGFAVTFGDHWMLGYTLRQQSREIRQGVGDRDIRWGSFSFSRRF